MHRAQEFRQRNGTEHGPLWTCRVHRRHLHRSYPIVLPYPKAILCGLSYSYPSTFLHRVHRVSDWCPDGPDLLPCADLTFDTFDNRCRCRTKDSQGEAADPADKPKYGIHKLDPGGIDNIDFKDLVESQSSKYTYWTISTHGLPFKYTQFLLSVHSVWFITVFNFGSGSKTLIFSKFFRVRNC